MRPIWRSRTGYYGLGEANGRYYPTVAGRDYPVAIDAAELGEMRDAIDRELPREPRRPGPTEYKERADMALETARRVTHERAAPDTLPPTGRVRHKGASHGA